MPYIIDGIPPDQLQRAEAVTEAVLMQLRLQTQQLTPEIDLATEYHPEGGS